MYDPDSFERTNQCCSLTTAAALEQFGHLIRWRSEGQDSVLDAGCGPGNVLAEVIYPFLKDKCSQIYAIDMSSEMLDYCRERHSTLDKDVQVNYWQMNVKREEDVNEFVDKNQPVDHVIASFLLHWLVDEEQGLRNIFKLLKPGGDFFSVHFHSTITFYMHEHIQRSVKWGQYFKDLDEHTPRSTTENHSEVELKETMNRCGFIDVMVNLKRSTWTISAEDFVTLIGSAHVQITNVPVNRRDEYMKDYVELAIEKNFVRVRPNGEYDFDFNIFVAFGRRPL